MRKIEIEFDAKAVDEYVLKLKEKLPQYDINVNNANDFEILLTLTIFIHLLYY